MFARHRCESERVFFKLQRTLMSIRSTMTEDRLEALLLLQCHREHCPTPDGVSRYRSGTLDHPEKSGILDHFALDDPATALQYQP